MNILSILPHPEDYSGSQRKPHRKLGGLYVLHREPFDTEVKIYEPEGDSYLLEWFEMERWLKHTLLLGEDFLRRLTDMLWNFYLVAFKADEEKCVPLRVSDSTGWEDEYPLAFKEIQKEEKQHASA